MMDRAVLRFQWEEQEEAVAKGKEEEEQQEREQMSLIDWHEFVVVETIEFTAEDDRIPLAAPIDTSTGAPQGQPQPLGEVMGRIAQEAHIERPKGVEEEEVREAEMDLDDEKKKKKNEEEKERLEKEKEKE